MISILNLIDKISFKLCKFSRVNDRYIDIGLVFCALFSLYCNSFLYLDMPVIKLGMQSVSFLFLLSMWDISNYKYFSGKHSICRVLTLVLFICIVLLPLVLVGMLYVSSLVYVVEILGVLCFLVVAFAVLKFRVFKRM